MFAFFDVCLHLKKVPPPKIPIRQPVNYLRVRFSMTTDNKTCHRIKKFCWQSNPKSPGLLFWVFYFRRTEFSTDAAVNPDRVPASSPEKLQAQTKICIFWNPAKLQAEQGFPDWIFLWTKGWGEWLSLIQKNLRPVYPLCRQRRVNIHL